MPSRQLVGHYTQPASRRRSAPTWTITPWLATVDIDSAGPGFQGDFATLFVTTPRARRSARSAGSQEGVDLVTTGGTVNVAAGTYAESVAVNKSVSILGAQDGINPRDGRTASGPAGVGGPGHWRQRV